MPPFTRSTISRRRIFGIYERTPRGPQCRCFTSQGKYANPWTGKASSVSMTRFPFPPLFPPFSSALDAGRCNRDGGKAKGKSGRGERGKERGISVDRPSSPFGHSTVTPKSNFHWDGNHRTSIRIRRYPQRFVRSRPPVAPTATARH